MQQNQEFSDKESNNDLNKCIDLIGQNKSFIFKVVLFSLVISVIISLIIPPTFSSTARILPPQRDNGLLGMMLGQAGASMAGVANDILGKGTSSDLFASILSTETIKDRIIDRFKLMEEYKKKFRVDTYRTLDQKVKIKAGKKDGIIVITVSDKNPQRAADIANAFVEELDRVAVDLSVNDAGRNKVFLQEQLAKARSGLAAAEEKLRAFQTKNKVPDPVEQAKGTIREVVELEAALSAEEIKLSGLKRIFTDSSTEVKNQQLVVDNLKKQISRLENGGGRSSIPSISSVPAIGQEYLRLMREFKTQEMLVEMLTKQHEMAKFNAANSVPGIQVIQKAKAPDKKVKPSRRLIVAGSVFLAFFGSIGFVFLRERFRTMPEDQKILLAKLAALFKPSAGSAS